MVGIGLGNHLCFCLPKSLSENHYSAIGYNGYWIYYILVIMWLQSSQRMESVFCFCRDTFKEEGNVRVPENLSFQWLCS